MSEPVLRIQGVTRRFGGLVAVRDVNLALLPRAITGRPAATSGLSCESGVMLEGSFCFETKLLLTRGGVRARRFDSG